MYSFLSIQQNLFKKNKHLNVNTMIQCFGWDGRHRFLRFEQTDAHWILIVKSGESGE